MPTPNLSLPQFTVTDTAKLDTLLNGITASLDANIPAYVTTAINARVAYSSRTKSANQAIATATWTLLTFQTADGESGITYNAGTFTAPSPGMYMLSGSISYASGNTTGQRTGGIYKNGSLSIQLPQMPPHTVGSNIVPISAGMILAAGDTFAIYAYHSAGANVNAELTKTTLAIARVA
jgi:hypothetical protein